MQELSQQDLAKAGMRETPEIAAVRTVRQYHERTKHALNAYAKGPEALDWSAQPNPFRVYDGTDFNWLPLVKLPETLGFTELIQQAVAPQAFSAKSLSVLLRLSLGLAQWKQYGTEKWALRCNPSSGNLHPTEAYVVLVGWDGFKNGVYHYDTYLHALALRCEFLDQTAFEPLLLLGLTSVHWREAWKYGERAFRYCHLDIGHALGSVAVAAAGLGWQTALLADGSDGRLTTLLGTGREEFNAVEPEFAEALVAVGTDYSLEEAGGIWESLVRAAGMGNWMGRPNLLDPKPLYRWPVINDVEIASKTPTLKKNIPLNVLSSEFAAYPGKFTRPLTITLTTELTAEQVILRRRSAQAYSPEFVLEQADFWQLMDSLTVENNWPGPAANNIHLIISVHKVAGLTPGFYLMNRADAAQYGNSLSSLKEALGRWQDWQIIPHPENHYQLQRIYPANVQRAVGSLCCQQRIAADCAIEIGFLAEFDAALIKNGAPAYRHLHWQAGLLGQRLYLAATALGFDGTGIGCFFDDAWHEVFGLATSQYQFVYHFAVGQALRDSRLVGLSGYFHLKDRPWESL